MTSPTYHTRLKVSGSQIKRVFFDFVLSQVDVDYPFRPECLLRFAVHTRKENPPQCATCGGRPWINPLWQAEHLKKLARQINSYRDLPGQFGLRVKRFEVASKCPVKLPVTIPDPPPANQTPLVSQEIKPQGDCAAVTVGEMI